MRGVSYAVLVLEREMGRRLLVETTGALAHELSPLLVLDCGSVSFYAFFFKIQKGVKWKTYLRHTQGTRAEQRQPAPSVTQEPSYR